MRRLLLLLFMLFMLALGQQVLARDNLNGILSQAYYEDKTNSLTPLEVQQQQFTPYGRMLTRGFSTGTYWLKLRMPASVDDLVLKIRPPFSEEIELFDPASNERKPKIGAKYPASASDIEALSYNYVLPHSDKERDVYLRLKSVRSYLAYVEAMPVEQFRKANQREQLIYSGYTAFTLILALWLLVTWAINKELVLGVFTLQQFMAFFHACFSTGVGQVLLADHVSPSIFNSMFSLVVVVYPFVAFLANKLLFDEYGLKKGYRLAFIVFLGLSSLIILLNFTGSYLTFKLNNVLILCGMLLFMGTSWFGLNLSRATIKANALPVAALRGFYTFNAIVWVVTVLPILGLIDIGEISMYSLLFYNIASGTVFFFMLQYRAKSLLRSETEKASALKIEADQERKQREEQSMLMAMLSHEIKTPLSVLKLVVDEKVAGSDLEGHANRAVGNINFIVNRCLQLGKLDAKAIQPNRTFFNGRDFLEELLRDYQSTSRVQLHVPSTLMVYADKDILRVVVSNIVDNALKYAASGSAIMIEMNGASKGAVCGITLTVRNTIGPMGAPEAEQIFKKYYRNPKATKITGSGLGLFLVHELVGVMGGEVTYTPEQQEVTFSIWIPH